MRALTGAAMERSMAYQAGQADYARGCDQSDNPYPMLSSDWHDWDAGLCDAYNDDDRCPDYEEAFPQ